ncbi:MAG: hypothetical protein JSS34_04835 [Proteobacteria bacterium]|nr:hypothetical protein [Pseudomonadota bacterium]
MNIKKRVYNTYLAVFLGTIALTFFEIKAEAPKEINLKEKSSHHHGHGARPHSVPPAPSTGKATNPTSNLPANNPPLNATLPNDAPHVD